QVKVRGGGRDHGGNYLVYGSGAPALWPWGTRCPGPPAPRPAGSPAGFDEGPTRAKLGDVKSLVQCAHSMRIVLRCQVGWASRHRADGVAFRPGCYTRV